MSDRRARRHSETRRRLRRRLEAQGVPAKVIDARVESLRRQQEVARRAGVPMDRLDDVHTATHEALRLDDRGYRPTGPDPLLRGPARATQASVRAARRSKATTRYEHQQRERGR